MPTRLPRDVPLLIQGLTEAEAEAAPDLFDFGVAGAAGATVVFGLRWVGGRDPGGPLVLDSRTGAMGIAPAQDGAFTAGVVARDTRARPDADRWPGDAVVDEVVVRRWEFSVESPGLGSDVATTQFNVVLKMKVYNLSDHQRTLGLREKFEAPGRGVNRQPPLADDDGLIDYCPPDVDRSNSAVLWKNVFYLYPIDVADPYVQRADPAPVAILHPYTFHTFLVDFSKTTVSAGTTDNITFALQDPPCGWAIDPRTGVISGAFPQTIYNEFGGVHEFLLSLPSTWQGSGRRSIDST